MPQHEVKKKKKKNQGAKNCQKNKMRKKQKIKTIIKKIIKNYVRITSSQTGFSYLVIVRIAYKLSNNLEFR